MYAQDGCKHPSPLLPQSSVQKGEGGGGVFLGAYDICVPHGSSTADLLRNWIPSCTMGAVM